MPKPTWGETELNIIQDTYAPPHAGGDINEIKILSDPETPLEPASVLQQAGRERERVSFDAWVGSQAELQALLEDKYKGEIRLFSGHDGKDFHAMIYDLVPDRRVFSHHIEFRITFIEATDPEEE